jgi:hypothetical protein
MTPTTKHIKFCRTFTNNAKSKWDNNIKLKKLLKVLLSSWINFPKTTVSRVKKKRLETRLKITNKKIYKNRKIPRIRKISQNLLRKINTKRTQRKENQSRHNLIPT